MTSGLKTTNERSATAIGLAAVALIAVLVSLIGLGILADKVRLQKRGSDLAFKRRDDETTAVFADLESRLSGNAAATAAVTRRQKDLESTMGKVTGAVNALGDRMAAVEAATGTDLWSPSQAERQAIKDAIATLKPGERSAAVKLQLSKERQVVIFFEGVDDQRVYIHGVNIELRNPVYKIRVCAKLTGYAAANKIVGVNLAMMQQLPRAA
jgi:hypothetical protein